MYARVVWGKGVLVEYYLLRLKQPEIRWFFALGLLNIKETEKGTRNNHLATVYHSFLLKA